jgi:hypothetical protein
VAAIVRQRRARRIGYILSLCSVNEAQNCSTEQGAWSTTYCATLPISSRSNLPCPCEPTTITSAPDSLDSATITLPGLPSLTTVIPRRLSRSATFPQVPSNGLQLPHALLRDSRQHPTMLLRAERMSLRHVTLARLYRESRNALRLPESRLAKSLIHLWSVVPLWRILNRQDGEALSLANKEAFLKP